MANEMSDDQNKENALESMLKESESTLAKARGLLKQKEDLYQRYGLTRAMLADTSDLTAHEKDKLEQQTRAFKDEIAREQRDARDRAKYSNMPVRTTTKTRHRAFI